LYHNCFFFFQAEDGIRYLTVTGVQTCALPISCRTGSSGNPARSESGGGGIRVLPAGRLGRRFGTGDAIQAARVGSAPAAAHSHEIGRASLGKEGRALWRVEDETRKEIEKKRAR